MLYFKKNRTITYAPNCKEKIEIDRTHDSDGVWRHHGCGGEDWQVRNVGQRVQEGNDREGDVNGPRKVPESWKLSPKLV